MASMKPTDFLKQAEEQRALDNKMSWEGTFTEYLELLEATPNAADLAHARMYDMITQAGMEDSADGGPREYKFFRHDIFGLERTLQQLVEEYLSPAARRLDIRKRILMLVGPVGGGKSTLVTLLKRGMERFSRMDDGAAYAIKGCPMHEEPLHLIPEDLRPEFKKQFGVYIEGDLCPVCRWRVKEEFGNKIDDVPVERIVLSEKTRIGIGTFKPAQPKSQDVAELTGSVNIQA